MINKGLQVAREKNLKYTPLLNKIVENKLLEGKAISLICKEFPIDESTFFNWCKQYPDFADSVREGQTGKIAKVAGAIYQSALGYTVEERTVKKDTEGNIETTIAEKYIKPSVTAQKHLLATQSVKADKWKDTQEINVTRKLESVLKDISNLEVIEAEIVDEDIDD